MSTCCISVSKHRRFQGSTPEHRLPGVFVKDADDDDDACCALKRLIDIRSLCCVR